MKRFLIGISLLGVAVQAYAQTKEEFAKTFDEKNPYQCSPIAPTPPAGYTREEQIEWYIKDGCPASLEEAKKLTRTLKRGKKYKYRRVLLDKERALKGNPPIKVKIPGEIQRR